MAKGEIIAVRGGEDFLVDQGVGDALGATNVPLARVFSLASGEFLGDGPLPVDSILARGYWDDPDEYDDVLLDAAREKLAAV